MEVVNNKELIPLEHYMESYRNADPLEMSGRTGFPYMEDTKQFKTMFLGREYMISWPEFEVICLDEKEDYSPLLETIQSKILMIRFLTEGASLPATGKFLTYRDVPWGEVYYRQFNGRCMMRLAFGYGNRLAEFRRVMDKLEALPLSSSDAGYQCEIFPGYFVQFLLWEGDDEFPPSSQILFSDNFPAGFHAEDLVVVAEVIIGAMKKL